MSEPEAQERLDDRETTSQTADMDEDEDFTYQEYYGYLNLKIPTTKEIGPRIGVVLERLIEVNEHCKSDPTLFDMAQPPKITLENYIKRIVDYANNSPESWVIALVVIERYVGNKENVHIHRLNIYKLFLTAAMVAAKFFDDEKISNASYAKIGGISRVEDLNVLEIELLQTINYSLKVDRSTFNDILLSIELDEDFGPKEAAEDIPH